MGEDGTRRCQLKGHWSYPSGTHRETEAQGGQSIFQCGFLSPPPYPWQFSTLCPPSKEWSLAIVLRKKNNKTKQLRDHSHQVGPFQRGEEPYSFQGTWGTTSGAETSSLPMTPGYFGMGITHALELTGCNWVVINSGQAFSLSYLHQSHLSIADCFSKSHSQC